MPAAAAAFPGLARRFCPAGGRVVWLRVLMSFAVAAGIAACETLPQARSFPAADAADMAGLAAAADRAYLEENWPDAEAAYRRLAAASPEIAEYWFRLGYISARRSRPGEAVRMYGKALEQDEHRVDAWHNLAMAQLQLAARSLGRVQERVPADDPNAERARRLIAGITALLESERIIAIEAALEQAP
jgi:tetratricopeptide (TPR) repeat protein